MTTHRFSKTWLLSIAVAAMSICCAPRVAVAAGCGESLSDFRVEGQSKSGNTVVYTSDLQPADGSQLSAHVDVMDASGRHFEVTVPRFAPIGPDRLPRLTPAGPDKTPYKTLIRFAWPNDPLTAIALTDVQTASEKVSRPCAAAPVQIQGYGDGELTTLYPDASLALAPGPRTAEPLAAPINEDAEIVKKTIPEYPVGERDLGIIGDVQVQLVVTASGSPSRVVVVRSSQSFNFDDAAAQAAASSLFRPATHMGVPVPRTYRLEYNFLLFPRPGGHELALGCKVKMQHVWLDGFDRTTSSFLYSIAFSAETNDVRSVMLDLDDEVHPIFRFGADDWTKSDSGAYTASASFLARGHLFGIAEIHSTTLAPNDRSLTCNLVPLAVWDNTNGMITQAEAQGAVNVQKPPLETQVVLPARFATRAWPDFPGSGSESGTQSNAVVLVTVENGSKPSQAILFSSSGNAAFDRAAIDAAMRSTYKHTGAEPQVFEALYDFESLTPGTT